MSLCLVIVKLFLICIYFPLLFLIYMTLEIIGIIGSIGNIRKKGTFIYKNTLRNI